MPFDPLTITRKYQENIGSNPLLDIPTLGATAGLGTYLLSKPILQSITNAAGMFGNPQIKAAVAGYLAPGGNWETGRNRLAILAAAAGSIYGIAKHLDWKNGVEGVTNSLMQKDYWKNNPQAVAKYINTNPKSMMEEATSMDKSAWGYDEGYEDPYHSQNIPVGSSINAVRQDPYMLQSNKNKVSSLLTNAAQGTHTSQASLVNTAVKAGVDFGAAYMFGTGVGKLLAMPDPIVNRVAMAGGLSAAVIGSGVLKHL